MKQAPLQKLPVTYMHVAHVSDDIVRKKESERQRAAKYRAKKRELLLLNNPDWKPDLSHRFKKGKSASPATQFQKGKSYSPATQFKKGQHWRNKKPFWDKEWLYEEYITKQRSSKEIAVQFNVTDGAIIFFLNKHQIPARTVSEARKIKYWGSVGSKNPMYGRIGDLNHNYKDGSTPERYKIYSRFVWKEVSKKVLERDNYCCVKCGSIRSVENNPLCIHHIKPWIRFPELRLEISNLITLCQTCHRFVHSKKNVNRQFLYMPKNELFFTDCMKYMSEHSDNYFELGSADPPYFKGIANMGFFGKKSSSIGVKRGDYEIPNWDNAIPDHRYFSELQRVSKNQIIWGANYYDFIGPVHPTPKREKIEQWLKDHPVGWIVWDKVNGNSTFNDFELAWTSFNEPTVVFKFMWNGMMQGKSLIEPTVQQGNKKLNQRRIHPTQKPIQLYKFQYRHFGIRGPIIETHAGSFSAGIAAYDMGIDITGLEIDEKTYLAALKRINEHRQQLKAF